MTDTTDFVETKIESTNPDETPSIKEENDDKSMSKYFCRVLFPSNITGLVVGKGGSKIKTIREKYDIDIHIKDSRGPERVIRFKGEDLDQICDAMGDVMEDWKKSMQRINTRLLEDQSEIRLIIHKNQCGPILGNKGEGLKSLRREHSCGVLLQREPLPNSQERICIISGLTKNCKQAIRHIYELAYKIDVGFDKKEWYDANDYKQHLARVYGGFTKDDYVDHSNNARTNRNSSGPSYAPQPMAVQGPPIPGWAPPPGQPMAMAYQPVQYQPMHGHPPLNFSYQQPMQPVYGQPMQPVAYAPVPAPQPQFNSGPRNHHAGGPQRNNNRNNRDNKPSYFRR